MGLSEWFKPWSKPGPKKERLKILVLSAPLDDRFVLEDLGKERNWDLRFASSPQEGFRLVSEHHFELILCESDQPGYPWREVMDRLSASSPRSCILLVSPVTGEYLWTDILQHGGYGVLTRPLRKQSALETLDTAARFISPATLSWG
jgi:CheY-like chemotaxis protein